MDFEPGLRIYQTRKSSVYIQKESWGIIHLMHDLRLLVLIGSCRRLTPLNKIIRLNMRYMLRLICKGLLFIDIYSMDG